MNIRAVRPDDTADINAMRVMDGVRENLLALASERITSTEDFLRGLTSDDHALVAEVTGSVVGLIVLHVFSKPRERHSGILGISVHAGYQGQGIGKALMTAILDLADNWLMLKRVELTVFTDNEPAVRLYQKMGFVIEGRKKFAAVRNGELVDEYLMARYGPQTDNKESM